MEDCPSGDLVDVRISELLRLTRLRKGLRGGAPAAAMPGNEVRDR